MGREMGLKTKEHDKVHSNTMIYFKGGSSVT